MTPTRNGRHAAPSEADGWRIVKEPGDPRYYWRMRAFQLEYNLWDSLLERWHYPWDTDPDSPIVALFRQHYPDLINELYLNP